MVFQHFALFPNRTIAENVEYGLEVQGIDRKTRRDKALAAIELVGLKGWDSRYPSQLSGGMQQRAGLARALAVDADILLMDEAFSALDPLIRRDMQDELRTLQRTLKKTVVFVSHDLDEAIHLGGRIVLMKDGAIVQSGYPEEILLKPQGEYVRRFVEHIDVSSVITAGRLASSETPSVPCKASADKAFAMVEGGAATVSSSPAIATRRSGVSRATSSVARAAATGRLKPSCRAASPRSAHRRCSNRYCRACLKSRMASRSWRRTAPISGRSRRRWRSGRCPERPMP